MIKGGYYYPTEMDKHLMHRSGDGSIVGDAQVGISFGNRTAGKTVGHGVRLIERFEKYGEQCVLLTRTDKQKQQNYLEKWWRNKIFTVSDEDGIIQHFVSSHEISFTFSEMTVDGEVMCYCLPISMSHEAKDTFAGEHVTNIVMDEATQGEAALNLNGRGALERITEIWQTAARGYKDAEKLCNIIYIANISSMDNWLFNDYGLYQFVTPETKQTCQKGFYIDIVNNTNAAEKVATSVMGGIMQRSAALNEYYEAAQNNTYKDNRSFVIKRGLDFKRLKIQFEQEYLRLGVFEYDDKLHVSVIDPDARSITVVGDVMKLREDTRYDRANLRIILAEMYMAGQLTFQDIRAKGAAMRYMGLYKE